MSNAFVKDKFQFGPTEQAGNDTTFSPTTYPRLQIAGSKTSGQVVMAPPQFSAYGFCGMAYLDSPTSTYNPFFTDTGLILVRAYTPTASTGSFVVTAATHPGTGGAGFTDYTGTFFNGAGNAYAGMFFNVTGFTNGGNNVSFVQCTASTATTLTLTNAAGVTETHAATATVAENFLIEGLESSIEVEPTAQDMTSTYPTALLGNLDILAPVNVSNPGGETDCTEFTMLMSTSSAPPLATITQVAITSNVLTITATNTFYPGQLVGFTNVGTATFLNNQVVQVQTQTGSSFTATFTHANYGPTADTGNVVSAQEHFWMRNVYTETFLGDGTSTPQYFNVFRMTNIAANSIGWLGSGAQGRITQSYAVSVEGPRENNVGTFGTRAALRMATQHGWRESAASQRINQSYGVYQEDNTINVMGSIYLGTALTGQWLLQGVASPDGIFSAALGSFYFRTNGLIYAKTQATSIPLTLASVATTALNSGIAVYTGTITGGGSNAFAGVYFTIAGFTNTQNNGTFRCTASTTSTLTLTNWNAISETTASTATYTDFNGWTPVNPGIVTKVTTYTATNDDGAILCNGTFTLTLPTTGIYSRKRYDIKNIGTGVITVSSAANIDASTTYTIGAQYQSITVEWDGTQYWIL